MTEAYLIENGEITEPLREGNLIGNGPQVLRDIDLLGNDFAMGSPGTCGKDGQGVPVGDGQPTLRVEVADDRRDRGVSRASTAPSCWRSPTRSSPRPSAGEQIEAYVSRGGETEVRVYEGEVEHFVSAQSEGIGIRVIRDGRTGFAYAGTLDPAAVDEVLAEARDNVAFGTVDEWAGLAEPDGVAAHRRSRCGTTTLAAFPTERKIELAKELERLTLAADRRVRVDDANYADAWGEVAVATTTGIRECGRENGCYVSVSTPRRRRRRDADRLRLQRRPASPTASTSTRRPRDAADRATRLLGATKPPSKRLTVVLDPFVTAQFLGVISSTLNGESVVKGRSLFRDRLGEQVAADARHARRRPDQPGRLHGHRRRRRGPRRPAQRADRGRRAAAVRAQQLLGPARRHGVDRQRHPRRVRRHARRRLPRPAAACRARARRPS